ncbi:MAG: hypothetical protein KIT58_00115 [Planctomycetota bacterium]|nr:hypothetical protein [Planctomycetota bacterium]
MTELEDLRAERDLAEVHLRCAQDRLAIVVRSYLGMLDDGLGHLRVDELREASRQEQEAYVTWSVAVDAIGAHHRRAEGGAP